MFDYQMAIGVAVGIWLYRVTHAVFVVIVNEIKSKDHREGIDSPPPPGSRPQRTK